MRSWALLVVFVAVTGCVVYRDDFDDSSWSSSGSSTTTPPPPSAEGQVAVSWRVGSAGCEAAGVETVEVDLDGFVEAFPCADESATFDAPSGRHPLTIRGLDAAGVARYAGDGGPVKVRRGEVTTASTVVLSGLPAQIGATWYFENGRLCAANGVGDVEVDLFDIDDTLVATATVACDTASAHLEDVEAGQYVLVVLGRDGDGEVVYSGDTLVDAGRGDTVDLDVVLVSEE